MNLGAIFIGLAVLILSIPFLVRPFLKKRQTAPVGQQEPADPGQGQTWQAERQNILSALRDLDFDFQIGKVAEEDHQTLRAQLLAEAARLTQDQKEEDDEIEALLRARREALANTIKCSQCGGHLNEADRFCPHCGAPGDVAAGEVYLFCPVCGSKTVPGARFCSRCGTRLVSQEAITRQD